jgi:hypothetical protein
VPREEVAADLGPGSVYLVRMDEVDQEWLERYRYPEG